MTRPQPLTFPGNPWTPGFLTVTVVAAVISGVVACVKHMPLYPWSALLALLSAVLASLAWNRFNALRAGAAATGQTSAVPYLLLAASFVVAAFGLSRQYNAAAEWVVLIAPYLLIILYQTMLATKRMALLWLAPVLFALLFLNTASLLGNLAYGGYPAALGLLLSAIVLATHELEFRTPVPADAETDPHIHVVHHKALAWISIIFFLFGVVSFWPWLGKIYGNAYFWIMIIGVLTPVLYLWGRLRQPRRQNSYAALLRFNRLIPYFGLMLLLAIALG